MSNTRTDKYKYVRKGQSIGSKKISHLFSKIITETKKTEQQTEKTDLFDLIDNAHLSLVTGGLLFMTGSIEGNGALAIIGLLFCILGCIKNDV